MSGIPVSVIVMTKNEERNIADAIGSVRGFSEVFVVDSRSTDATVDIARKYGAQVIDFEWNGKYPKKKQWCLENLPFASNWVLYLDADERVTASLARELEALFSRGEPLEAGFFIGLEYVFLGRALKYGHRGYKIALLDRRRSRFADRDDLDLTDMEVECHYQPYVEGTVGRLSARIEHRDHDDLSAYFRRHIDYMDWEAGLRIKGGLVGDVNDEAQVAIRRIAKQALAWLPGKSLFFFFYSYIVKLGFLDGRAGLHYALAKSVYYWQIDLKTQELKSKA